MDKTKRKVSVAIAQAYADYMVHVATIYLDNAMRTEAYCDLRGELVQEIKARCPERRRGAYADNYVDIWFDGRADQEPYNLPLTDLLDMIDEAVDQGRRAA